MIHKGVLLSTLSQVCWRSGMLVGLERLAGSAQLKRGNDGTAAFPYVCRRRLPNFQILTYHRLTNNYDPFFPGLRVEVFASQVDYLARNYQLVDLAELIQKIKTHEPIPPNAVALTFDDGYRDNFDLAFPVMLRHRARLTVFLTTGFLDRQEILWNDKVSFALKYTKRRSLVIDCEGRLLSYELKTVDQRLGARQEILWRLRHISHVNKLAIIESLLNHLEISDFQFLRESMLTWDQVRDMHANGISFGAHTVTHPILSRVPLEQARKEILASKQAIEARLLTPVALFAYPAGTLVDFNEDLKMLLKEAGFIGAVTTVFGTNNPASDLFELRRSRSPEEPGIALFASRQCWYKFAM